MAKTVTHQDLQSYFGDEDHLEKAQRTSFAGMIFEALSDRAPIDAELKVFELILNLSIDHGPETPSAVPLIEAAKSGKSVSESLSAGILEINEHHGGAVEGAMRNIYEVKSEGGRVKSFVTEQVEAGKRMAGMGHRIYKDVDPRADLIFRVMRESGMSEEFIRLEEGLAKEFEVQTGKHLPINIDGAIAVVLCTFGWEARLGNAVFIIARVPGLCAHFLNNS
jgi:citrate synthase